MFAKAAWLSPRRLLHSTVSAIRRHPATIAYLAILLAVHLAFELWLSNTQVRSIELTLSTNIHNLIHHPFVVLVGSGLVFDGSTLSPVTIFGIGCGMAWIERRHGSLRAFSAFWAGHIGATLLTVPIIVLGLWAGYYPTDVSRAYDFGISYGGLAIAGAVTGLFDGKLRLAWALLLAGYVVVTVAKSVQPPGFTTFGHIVSLAIGLCIAARIAVLRRRSKAQLQM